ncbi:HEAT repeat domain-containing protein [Sporosarcina sp. CAU 1771]
MKNNYLEKVEPFIVYQEPLVQEIVVQSLEHYPEVPVGWTNSILEDLVQQPEINTSILVWLNKRNLDAKSVPLLIQLMDKLPDDRKHMGKSFLFSLNPEIVIAHEKELAVYFTKEQMNFYHNLLSSDQEELRTKFIDKVEYLEQQDRFNQSHFMEAKIIQDELFRRNWIDESELDKVITSELENDSFTYHGIFAVRAIGFLKLPSYIPILADLLARDEDLLLEETAEALIQYQSDQVVEAVKPYAMNEDTYIFALSVIENTKTDYAADVLIECYDVLNEDGKGMVIEGLAHHFTEKAFPLIEDYLFQEYHYGANDMKQILYSFYKVMGRTHPDSEKWKASSERREQIYSENKMQAKSVPVTATKVGRNDPCPCGSGKKYKKCCE